jgi:GDP-L-fucose synthase
VVGYQGRIEFDSTKPDGAPRKLMDVSRLKQLGWQAQVSLEQGLQQTYQWFLENQHNFRA